MADMSEKERADWFTQRREQTNQHAADRQVWKAKEMPAVLGAVVQALRGLRIEKSKAYPEGCWCWCGCAIDSPMATTHSDECVAAQAAMRRAEELEK